MEIPRFGCFLLNLVLVDYTVLYKNLEHGDGFNLNTPIIHHFKRRLQTEMLYLKWKPANDSMRWRFQVDLRPSTTLISLIRHADQLIRDSQGIYT